MLKEILNQKNTLNKCLLSTFLAFLFIFAGMTKVSAAPLAPVSAFPLKADSARFTWQVSGDIDIAQTKEELMQQYVAKIAAVPDNQSTFTIQLASTKEVYDWAVQKAMNYNSLPTRGNPLVQNSYHIFAINPKPYYAGDNVRRFDVLVSIGKDIRDSNLRAESIQTSKEMAVLAQDIARNIADLNDRAKLNYIDDWLAYHFNYDYSLKKYTAAEGYKTGQFVCCGYTEMFKLIADYAGMGNRVEVACGDINVQGARGFHSWIIYTGSNGVRYLIDPTHNDYRGTRQSCKRWFMLNEQYVQGYSQTSSLKPAQAAFEQ